MLVQRARAGTLSGRFDDNASRNTKLEAQFGSATAPSPVLHAQDIVRGYRIDIWDSVTGRWQSLCRRNARYELGDTPLVVNVLPEEESVVRLAATQVERSRLERRRLVSARSPRVVDRVESRRAPAGPCDQTRRQLPDDGRSDRSRNAAGPEVHIAFYAGEGFAAATAVRPVVLDPRPRRRSRGQFPRAADQGLRGGGAGRRMRSRICATNRSPRRSSRCFRSRGRSGRPLEGESMARVAIRSFNDTPDDNLQPTTQVAHRVAAPPQVSVRDAEQHGMLDRNGRHRRVAVQSARTPEGRRPRDAPRRRFANRSCCSRGHSIPFLPRPRSPCTSRAASSHICRSAGASKSPYASSIIRTSRIARSSASRSIRPAFGPTRGRS